MLSELATTITLRRSTQNVQPDVHAGKQQLGRKLAPMNQMSRATGSREGRRIQYGFVCVPIAFSHLQWARVSSDHSTCMV